MAQKIGLALGGGSAKGCAHLGVFQYLEENTIQAQMVSGTSIGSFAGAVYAAGKHKELLEFSKTITWQMIVQHLDLAFPRQGIMSGKRLEKFLKKFLPYQNIEDLPIPFYAIATDISTGEEIILDKGPLIPAIRASISLPVIFTPIEKEGRLLADGGLVNPLPINVLRNKGAEKIIAVDLNHGVNYLTKSEDETSEKSKTPSFFDEMKQHYQELTDPIKKQWQEWFKTDQPAMFDVLGWSVNIMQDQITQKNLAEFPADVLLRPPLGNIRGVDFHKAEEMITTGYQEAQKHRSELLKLSQ